MAVFVGLSLPAPTLGWQAAQVLTIEGKLVSLPSVGPVLKSHAKEYPLLGQSSYLFHTLQDKRLLNRELRLEGTQKPDGMFEVTKIFTVHDGKVFRLRYYCETCNIEFVEPGNCVCCQQPTELQEIPVANDKK